MPELPEVQTIVTDLNQKIKGDTITDFWSDAPGAIKNATADKFKKEIVGRKILLAHRIGKNMFIDLSGGKTIYIHLKMTGHLLVKFPISNFQFPNKSKTQISKNKEDYFSDRVNQYIHHIFYLGKDKTLEFSDMRKFAKIVLLDTDKIKEYKDIKDLGMDVMDPGFTFALFDSILTKKEKQPIGIVLMDQSLIAGIGNIYRSEILFESGILPTRKAKDIDESERKKIYQNIKKVLEKAIKYRGTSDSDYRDTAGAPGGFQKVMKVYNKEKQKCQKCDTIIKRMKIGQRSAFYCPKCQV